jgi:preprotein translocase subunit SecD
MIRRRLWASLLGCLGISFVLLALNLGLGNTPALGLDLQGGVSVVLAPDTGASGDDLLVIRDLIRDELENRGIGEPDVRVEGSNIVVDLPGVKDQRDALDAVDVAGIVTLRPVYQCFGPPTEGAGSSVPGSSVPGSTSPGSTPPGSGVDGSAPPPSAAGAPTTVAGAAPTTSSAAAGFGGGAARSREIYERPAALLATPPTTAPPSPTLPASATPTTAPPAGEASATTVPGSTVPGSSVPTTGTTVPASTPDTTVLRTLDGGQCLVGPAGGAGDEIFRRDSSEVQLLQGEGWAVSVGLSPLGEASWNALAAACFSGSDTCPSRQLAIVLDDVIQSAPTVNEPQFSDSVSISGSFTESEARSLSRVLNRGAFPTQVEVRRVDTVSPTLGEDSLRASVLAGLVGVLLLVLVLVLFYRRLTLLIAAGMIVWGMLIYSVSVFISQTTNYALTLAGVTGIVVSIGMTVDSYVVYFERMKDEVLHGRTFRNSAARSFASTWKTILAANLVSFIAAAVLFVLSVGSVRGFALYLGVTTICDVVVLWFFTRPAVILMAATGRLDGHDPFGLGPLPAPAPVPAPERGAP